VSLVGSIRKKDIYMRVFRNLKKLSAIALCSAVLFVPTVAMTQDNADAKAIATRQGYMKLVVWEAGPLFGMAKGDMAYDAEAAKTHAANLKIISQYPVGGLFWPDTSSENYPGKTRALPKIWEDQAGFSKALTEWQAAVETVNSEAGNGQPALAAAIGELGKSCGGCHKPFRAKED
jgi:cytochrome c556